VNLIERPGRLIAQALLRSFRPSKSASRAQAHAAAAGLVGTPSVELTRRR